MKLFKILSITLILFATACGSSENKLTGTWKVEDVDTQFDENRMTPAMVLQVVEMQKETYFRILNDSVIIIVSSDNTHEAKWEYNNSDNVVNYYFESTPNRKNKLGSLVEGKIISESNTPIGKMTITYAKEK
jgi:hypothetical protein